MDTSRTLITGTAIARALASRRRVALSALAACILALLGPTTGLAAEPIRIDFGSDAIGSPPSGFSAARTGDGEPGRWVVEDDPSSPGSRVLVQRSADPTSGRFPLLVYDALSARDVDVSVRFEPLAGKVDQAAGIVWRYRDEGSYYVVRANALEGNVVLYKVERGKRSDLKPVDAGMFAYGRKAPVPSGKWSTLAVRARGTRFTVSLDGKHLFDVEDDTFRDAGRVGLWTKADSVTAFDDLTIESLDAARP